MKNYWFISILIMMSLVGLSIWIYIFPYQKHQATKATNKYLQAQGVKLENIQSRAIKKDWKMGGYMTTVEYKNDRNICYIYMYDKRYKNKGKLPYGIFLDISKSGSSLKNNQVHYPPLPGNYKAK